tara:strand:- start:61 stop:270 length:210 start_codon:yes stop_codon:yes gene_type:complete
MAITSKTFIHSDSKLLGDETAAVGFLPRDVEDWISANGGTIDNTSNMNITCCPYGANQIFTLIVIDDNS